MIAETTRPVRAFERRIRFIPANGPAAAAGALHEILGGKLDGFVLTEFLTPSECESVLRGFRGLSEEERVRADKGLTSYPASFAQQDQMARTGHPASRGYHESVDRFRDTFESRFGVAVERRLIEILERAAPGVTAHVAEDPDGRRFAPFTFRELAPGAGTLKAHCEHLFFQEFPGFFDRFSHFTDNRTPVSFFLVLQSPGKGGALALYDLRWREGQRRVTDTTVVLPDGSRIDVDDETQIAQQRLMPETGSLVVFAGGTLWHRVDLVLEAPSRVTLGGFLSFSPDRSRMYLWS